MHKYIHINKNMHLYPFKHMKATLLEYTVQVDANSVAKEEIQLIGRCLTFQT